MCSLDCADAVCDVLNDSGMYRAKMIGPHSFPEMEFSVKNLMKADCLVIPGGWGDSDQFDQQLISYSDIIIDYIAKGGKYLGICMGSYFVGSHYLNILNKADAVQYVRRKGATIHHENHDVVNLLWEREQRSVYFHDGAAFIPKGAKKIPADIIATYQNGDAAALIQKYKKGKIGVIGPHPEAMKWWFYSQTRIKTRWKDCIQHDLLLNFVEKLLK
jgi:glutamine amidotransferase-like uncharacterized protein